ncbi:MAG TPA: hypothetical protein VFQ54_07890, partial [Thermomicrobiales bacterium]|nr:hypothetical protein [Thermomicrobiales bacterium]
MQYAPLRGRRRGRKGLRFLSTATFLVLTFGSLLSVLASPTVSADDATPNVDMTPTAPSGSADLTVNLFDCPAGYDLSDPGANPAADCTEPANGATFTIDGQNSGYFSQENTGDSVNGAVYFGGVP